MTHQPIFCPDCNSRDNWRIDVEQKGKKLIITITCKCGFHKQYVGVGESI